LSIPDFPTTYGQLLPPMTQEGVHEAFDAYWLDVSYEHIPPYEYSVGQVHVHFAHRVWAMAVAAAAVLLACWLGPILRDHRALALSLAAYFALLVVHVGLAMSVLWTETHPALATARGTIGPIMLPIGTVLLVRVSLIGRAACRQPAPRVPRLNGTLGLAG